MRSLLNVAAIAAVALFASCSSSTEENTTTISARDAEALFLTIDELMDQIQVSNLVGETNKPSPESFRKFESLHYHFISESSGIHLFSSILWHVEDAQTFAGRLADASVRDASYYLKNRVTRSDYIPSKPWGDTLNITTLVADGKNVGNLITGITGDRVYSWVLWGAYVDPMLLESLLMPKLEAFERQPPPRRYHRESIIP